MKTYLSSRQQSVYINGSFSNIIDIGDSGCFQGTIMAMLLYVLYVLDQPYLVHMECQHFNSYEENDDCEKHFLANYIDHNFSEITANRWTDIENEAEKYLKKIKKNIMTTTNLI